MLKIRLMMLACALTTAAGAAHSAPLPARVGQCATTRIMLVGSRLQNMPASGSSVAYDNEGYQVSYDRIRAIEHSRSGDPVRLCLVSIPRGCPPSDDRGRIYKAINLRTHETWTLPDSEHKCGGA